MQCISFLRFLLPLKVRLLHLGKATRRLLEFSTSLNIGLICLSKEASISTIPFTQESRIISSQARIISSQDYTETLKQLGEARILNLFQRKYTHSLLVGVGLMVLQQFVGVNGIAFYASSIFVSAGFPGNIGTIAMICVQVPMTALGMMLTDKSGRKALLMVSAAGTCLGCSLIGLSFSSQGLQHFKDISPFMALIGVLVSQAKPEKILFIKISFPPLEISGRFYFLLVHKFLSQVFTGSFSLGMGGIPWVIMSEIFPINMKGSAGSLVTLVNWGGSWIISYAFNFLMNWNSAVTFFMFASVSVMTIIFVAKFVPETKGQTLEEIQASMNPLSSEG